MNESIEGTVIEMDVSHMVAAIKLRGDSIIDTEVDRIYDIGDLILITDMYDIDKPWYLQGEEYIDVNPVCEAKMLRGYKL